MKEYQELKITYKNGQPDGIRYKGGYLFFFPTVSKYTGQDERYRREIEDRYELADYLLSTLMQIENPDLGRGLGE